MAAPEEVRVSESVTVLERLGRVFASQADAALRLRSSTAAERTAKIKKLRDAVLARREEWYAAGWADFHKPQGEMDLGEILPVCVEANKAMRHLRSWMQPTTVWPTLLTHGTRSSVQFVPKGRVLIIGPFNYPINLLLGPLVSAIAAGNAVILKPSELTPHMSGLLSRLIADCFAPDEVALFEGEVDVAQALLALPFDHFFFTGSPAVGKIVMAAAAKHLASVTLELGGKSPTIVDASADLKVAAKNIVFAKFANAGQTCIAPDYLLVDTKVKDKLVELIVWEIQRAYGKTVEAQSGTEGLAHLVNARHFARVKALLDDALQKGARVLEGGGSAAEQCFIQPTLLDGVAEDSQVMTEEIFGPLLPILAFDDLGEAIAHVNAGPKPLALYLFSHTSRNISRVLRETVSGGVCTNGSLIQFLHGSLPFGGIGTSGVGNAHGHWGFKAFSHERACVRVRLSLVATLFPAGIAPDWLRAAMRIGSKWV